MLKVYTVAFCGNKVDHYGMPDPYHHYLIVVDSLRSGKDSVATVLPLTNAPMPEQTHFLEPWTPHASHDAATAAINALRNLPENKGLQEFINKTST